MAHSSKNFGFVIVSTEQQSNGALAYISPSFIHAIRPKEIIPLDVDHIVGN